MKQEQHSECISRRKLIIGAGAIGATAAVGSLAIQGKAEEASSDVSDATSEDQSAEYVEKHGATARTKSFAACTYDTDEPAPIEPPDTWDDEADIVVVGLGGGMAGAARAAYLGNSVIAIDKASSFGGTSQEACQYVMVCGSRCQNEAGIEDETQKWHDLILSLQPQGEKYEKHISNILQGAKDLVAWTEELGLEWQPSTVYGEDKVGWTVVPVGSEEGWNSYRIISIVEEFYDKVFTENNGRYMFNSPITGLVMDGDAVVGVQVTPDETGEPICIKANKGVLLSAGGMTNNLAMLQKYVPRALQMATVNTAGAYDNGDAIRIGLGAGAMLEGYNNCGFFDGGIDGVDWNHHLYAADIQIARQPWLQVDVMGDRKAYEPLDYETCGNNIASMPGSHVFSFFDANWETDCEDFELPMCRDLITPDMPNQDRWDGRLNNDYTVGVKQAIEEGRIASADTPEELAEKLGIPPEKVATAFDDWNEMVASGDGSEWGYTDPNWLHPLDTPPYYGQSLGVMMFSTRCGLSVDENNQVIDTNGNLIPGLFAAGATSGRPASCICGDCCYSAVSSFNSVNKMCE
jgi:fumarate reductase flavoprotein subunit